LTEAKLLMTLTWLILNITATSNNTKTKQPSKKTATICTS